jgi:hypothetical protein
MISAVSAQAATSYAQWEISSRVRAARAPRVGFHLSNPIGLI